MTIQIQRREFVVGLGSAAAWPLAARAQQPEDVRRLGVLMGWSESDPNYQSRVAVLVERLGQLGWVQGRNLQIEVRWTNGSAAMAPLLAKELVELRPDLIVAGSTPAAVAVHKATASIPIVFVVVSDPVGAGLVPSLSRPGGNITGFINVEASMGGKWLALLKEVAPDIKRAGMMFNPDTAPGRGRYFLPSFEAAARLLAVEPQPMEVRSSAAVDDLIGGLAGKQAGLIAVSDSFMGVVRGEIITSTARYRVPAITGVDSYIEDGGLMSYGPNNLDIFRRAAGHVDRILRGAKSADLPVEEPIKFDLMINVKTARALGLTVPPSLLATADKVIE